MKNNKVKNMDLITTKEMTLTLKCVCLTREEFEKIHDYYTYIGVEFYDKEGGGSYIGYFYMRKIPSQCINEHLDIRNLESLPLRICEIAE